MIVYIKVCSHVQDSTTPASPRSFHLSILRLYTIHFHNKFNFLNKNEQSRIRYIFLLFTLDFLLILIFQFFFGFVENMSSFIVQSSVLTVVSVVFILLLIHKIDRIVQRRERNGMKSELEFDSE